MKYHAILYSCDDSEAIQGTVEARNANHACQLVVAKVLKVSSEEASRLLADGAVEVICVIEGHPVFAQTTWLNLFPFRGS